jgi:HJR/Mrr/RecB family endonuclease
MLPEWERRHRKYLEEAEKETDWDNLKGMMLLGAIFGGVLGAGLGSYVGATESGAVVGAGVGAIWMVVEAFRRRNQALSAPTPTVEQIRQFIDERPKSAARDVDAFKRTLRQRYALEASGIAEADQMTGEGFEELVAGIFRRRGYTVRTTPVTRDYGVDVIVEGAGERTAVQCKRRQPNDLLGPAPIQEVYAGKEFHGCKNALVVTNARFSEQARAMARKLGVDLWDRDRLIVELTQSQTRLSWEQYLQRHYEGW